MHMIRHLPLHAITITFSFNRLANFLLFCSYIIWGPCNIHFFGKILGALASRFP